MVIARWLYMIAMKDKQGKIIQKGDNNMVTIWQVYFHATGAEYCRTFDTEAEATKFYNSMAIIDKRVKLQKRTYEAR